MIGTPFGDAPCVGFRRNRGIKLGATKTFHRSPKAAITANKLWRQIRDPTRDSERRLQHDPGAGH
jgi:hypothetical protein